MEVVEETETILKHSKTVHLTAHLVSNAMIKYQITF